jgi:hypothetical protein
MKAVRFHEYGDADVLRGLMLERCRARSFFSLQPAEAHVVNTTGRAG